MGRAVTSYAQLLTEIDALPPPAAGKVRVFRGQTKDYGAILSSFGRIRRSQSGNEIFNVFMQHLFIKSGLLTVLGDLKKLPRLSPIDIDVSPADYFMAEALVQHYGYQTRYIDVTPSPEVAVWFATHKFHGTADAKVDNRLTFPAWHTAASEPGVLYVLDVKPWNGISSAEEGDYIDLLGIAPEGVNRPRRQQGGVVFAPGSGAGAGDIAGWLHTKFEVRFSWEEVGKPWDTDFVFPGPGEDTIYSTLLQAPFFRMARPRADGTEETVYRRSCTLPEYGRGPDDTERRALYRTFDRTLTPTLYHPWLMRNLDRLQANPAWPNLRSGFEKAGPILLTRPHMLFSLRRGGAPTPPSEPLKEVPVPFRNFFLELSPESFALAYDETRMARGFWCIWLGAGEFLLQSFGTLQGQPRGSEIHIFRWEAGRGLVQRAGPAISGSYVTFPLDLIRMTTEGLLKLLPPGRLGHGYYELTTTERFWPALGGWTDLL